MFTITIPVRTVALAYRHGTFSRLLEAGRHVKRWGERYQSIDLRARLLVLAPQEVPTADGLAVRVTPAITWRVVDPVAFHEVSADPVGMVYLATQLALRDALAGQQAGDLARRSAVLPLASATAAVQAAAAGVGIEVSAVVVKDVLLPHEFRAAATELAIAKTTSEAKLEAARAETAALRALANGAKLLAENPALAKLRMIQAAPYGAKVVIDTREG